MYCSSREPKRSLIGSHCQLLTFRLRTRNLPAVQEQTRPFHGPTTSNRSTRIRLVAMIHAYTLAYARGLTLGSQADILGAWVE